MPDLGEGLPEAEIVQWLVAPGDTVKLNQTIAEVETAKAVVELPSPYAGTVRDVRAEAGETVAVGAVLISFEVDAAGAPAAPSAVPAGAESNSTPAGEAGAEPADPPNLVGYGAAPRSGARPQRRARAGRAAPAADTAVLEAAPHDAVTSQPPPDTRHERPRSTPPVRKLAKDLGIDLALVEASGASGIITRADVEEYAARTAERQAPVSAAPTRSAAQLPADDLPGGDRETRMPIRGVRKATAQAMVASAFTAPHVTSFLTVDVTATTELLARLRSDKRLADHRIGIMAVAAKAVCLALRARPELNSRWDEAAAEIVQFHYVNLGVAAATERGLVVPNIKDADRMGLAALADAIGELAQTARSGKTGLDALRGGTFSITNFGVFGVDAGTPILNPGEAGILGLGAVRRQPWEHEGEIALRDVMTLSLSFDHRLADGEQGSRFLVDVADVLREPGRAML
nr:MULTISPECIES: dihydrolipoamide acetyltransferase family protein [Microbacterium]